MDCFTFVNIKKIELPLAHRILVSPLDWGLGHTSRCIPIIKTLQNNSFSVLVACNATQQAYLSKEITQVEYIRLAGYDVQYATSSAGLIWKMILQIPKIIYRIYAEHKALKNIITNYKIDAVISDNRFGLYSSKIPCVFITHQLFIKTPFLSTLVFSMNHFFIKKYNTCWVPDCNNTESLSGELSSTKWQIKTPIQRIGFLSRFKQPIAFDGVKRKSILCILSGPEPQRSMLMKMIIQQVSNANYTCTIIGAKSGSLLHHTENIQCMPVADAIQMELLLATHQYIITRSGYSSLMDFAVIKRTAILIPTPGQSEQEYLGKLLQEKQMHYSCQQQLFNLEVAIKAIDEGNWKTVNVTKNNNLQNAILELGNGIISK